MHRLVQEQQLLQHLQRRQLPEGQLLPAAYSKGFQGEYQGLRFAVSLTEWEALQKAPQLLYLIVKCG
jgi:hypothetical protein